ncbi:uncharacterized protein LOC119590986 [Penaeus monodon]|uniref:uncharacterized protein LOC119590986 n=1 Tax=Penaeus monodon TaxID=6687 RepID=UPI0018A70441|nr:uncharacterized protein LOC119590986 [Penaeus monodon]
MVSDQYSEDIVSQEAKSLIVSVNANQEQDAPPTKKKKIREEEVVDVMREKAEEKTNILSQAREEDEMAMPPPQKRPGKRSVGGQGAVSRRPLTAHPNPKQLGRRFTTASKRKTEKTKSGEDPSSSAEENEVPSQVILSNRSRGINLTGEQECDVVDWFQEHEIFYNKKLTDYRETGKKARLLEEKAAELSLHVNQLKTWYDGMRTRFARISSTRSGQVPVLDELTERDRWIYNSFQFLRPHIVRVPSRQSKTFKRKEPVPRPSTSSISDVQVLADDEVRQDIDTPPANASVPTSTPSRSSPSLAATPDERQEQLLEKLSQQYQQTMALHNRLVATLQPQSTHVKQVAHFMAFLGSLCETMTPSALKSFMIKTHQLAFEHTPHSTDPPPPSTDDTHAS